MNRSDLLSSLKPFISISKYSGCFPFRIDIVNHYKISVKVSKFEIIYGIGLLLASTSYLVYNIIFFKTDLHSGELFDVLYDIDSVIICSGILISFVENLYNVQAFAKILKKFFYYTKYLKDFKFYYKIFWGTIGVSVYYVINNIVGFVVYFVYQRNSEALYIWEGLLLGYLYFLITLIVQKFSYSLIYLSKIIEALNDELGQLSERNLWLCENCNGSHQLLNEWTKKLSVWSVTKKINLSTFVESYMKICYLLEDVNNCFGLSLASAVLISFLCMLESSYQFLMHGQIIIFVVNFGYFVPYVWLMLYSCEVAMDEVREIFLCK